MQISHITGSLDKGPWLKLLLERKECLRLLQKQLKHQMKTAIWACMPALFLLVLWISVRFSCWLSYLSNDDNVIHCSPIVILRVK